MIQEKSCGAVLFREEDVRTYLVLHSTQGHYTLCKGHVENGETEHETAVREIGEETGLSVTFREGFRESIVYAPRPGCRKEVVFFLAEAAGGAICCQPEEVADADFLPYPQAISRLTHDSDREVLAKAERFLCSH
ncbi:MAG: NUDIX domain-containing protein [Clostridia bacterium]|nr:NUDIX domain-containing protein [Clostridia bacterium]